MPKLVSSMFEHGRFVRFARSGRLSTILFSSRTRLNVLLLNSRWRGHLAYVDRVRSIGQGEHASIVFGDELIDCIILAREWSSERGTLQRGVIVIVRACYCAGLKLKGGKKFSL